MKKCTVCEVDKPLDSFSRQLKGRFGVTSICKVCTSERGKAWHRANLVRSKAAKAIYNASNKLKAKKYGVAWREANKSRLKVQAAKWVANNPEKKRASVARRRALKLRAIPAWANPVAILGFYSLASELTKSTGVRANVDHVVPLASVFVCGLHCEANLSIIAETHNKEKGNLWWPQMWGRDLELDS